MRISYFVFMDALDAVLMHILNGAFMHILDAVFMHILHVAFIHVLYDVHGFDFRRVDTVAIEHGKGQ